MRKNVYNFNHEASFIVGWLKEKYNLKMAASRARKAKEKEAKKAAKMSAKAAKSKE